MNKTEDTFELIVTINDSNINRNTLISFVNNGATFFRLNGAFLGSEKIAHIVDVVRSTFGKKIKLLLDLPGYKIRFLHLPEDIRFEKGVPFNLQASYLNYPKVLETIEIGSVARINDGMDRLTVIKKNKNEIVCVGDRTGVIKKGKGVHLDCVSYRHSANSLSEVDDKLIGIAKQYLFDYVGLSFVYNADDIKFVNSKLYGTKIKILPKIESKESINNLLEILKMSDEFIIDRGDLAGEIGLEHIWQMQRKIISLCKMLDKKVYVATQVLLSMVRNPIPSIAEVDSFYSLLDVGINGVQLSDETCLGQYAVESVALLRDIYERRKLNAKGKTKQGLVVWLMGPTSSGKTTIADKVVDKLVQSGFETFHCDGDEVRNMFGSEHGFSRDNRLTVVKNLVYLANKVALSGYIVIVSALTAHPDAREYIRKNIDNLITVFIKCGIETCIKRDPKGLYKKALNGEINTLIGVNSPYITPKEATITIDSEKMSPDDATSTIIAYLLHNRLLNDG